MASSGAGLQIVDLTNPSNLVLVSSLDPGGYVSDVAVAGNYAYLAAGDDGLQVIDIRNPSQPRRVGGVDTDGSSVEVAVAGDYAYVADGDPNLQGNGGLQIIDISAPGDPQQVGLYQTDGSTVAVAVFGHYAYLLEGPYQRGTKAGGLHVIDISDPANPVRVGGNLNGIPAEALTIANGKLFVAAGEQGLMILHPYQPLYFESLAQEDSGTLRMRITGPPEVPARMQRSADLNTWSDWRPLVFGEEPLEISDPDASANSAGFYRVVVP